MDSIVSDFYQYVSGMMSEGSCEERDLCKRKSPVERKEDQRSESTETGSKEKKMNHS